MRLAILLSGRGSNFLAIHEAIARGELAAEIVAVLSNRPDAPGLARARELGYASHAVNHRAFANRAAHESEVLAVLAAANPDLVVLAGYMRLLGPQFLDAYRDRIVNIHPSLLPAFPGVDAQAQAIAHGVKISGCTVHLVDEGLDAGPIVVQRAVPVLENDDASALAARILVEEHAAYVEALAKLARGYRVEGRRIVFSLRSAPTESAL
ncbi:MAG TPA: phosphoribosylglycinamide formyltransferase [Thermoanaerobaculia bacterium]|nr:phosphoribosylglycinamide formyltransferase [Thermoanaerobaculia bacterium]